MWSGSLKAGTSRESSLLIYEGHVPRRKGSGAWVVGKTGKQQEKKWGSGELYVLSRLKDDLHAIRATTGWAYLWR
jgi:hypothetical protein